MKSLKAAGKLAVFLLLCALTIPAQSLVLMFVKGRGAYILPRLWHRVMRRVFGLRIEVRGRPAADTQTVYMSNHLSYLDIVVLGSLLDASFLAKSEVRSWPLWGTLARLQNTAYIERKKTAIVGAKNTLEKMLDGGASLIIFPEGTSTSGLNVRPFKSSLFALALSPTREISLQPVTIAITETDGRIPHSKEDNDIYAWPLEMETSLPAHLWAFAKTSGARLVITFHSPLRAGAGADRKALAKACHDSVSKGLDAAAFRAPENDNQQQERSHDRIESAGNKQAADLSAE